jgi:hypothetical protein
LGINNITDFLLIELEDYKILEYSFYTTGEKPEDAPVEQARSYPLVNI